MPVRMNVNIPTALFNASQKLVEQGLFSNFSELIRDGLRKEIKEHEDKILSVSEDEKKLFALLQQADKEGLLVDEKEMEKNGLRI